jgi:PAS domain S-box-containing protein
MKRPEMFIRILTVVAGVEVLVMVLLGFLGLPEGPVKNLLDAAILSAFSAPLLYLSVIRTATRRLSERAELAKKNLEQEFALKEYAGKLELKEAAEEQARIQSQRMELLGRVHSAILGECDIDRVLSEAARDICRVLSLPCCAIRIFGDPGKTAEHCEPGVTPVISTLAPSRYPPECLASFASGKYAVTDRSRTSFCCPDQEGRAARSGLRAHLEVPLRHPEGLVGILFLGRTEERPWTGDEIAAAEAIAGGLAVAMRHERVFRSQKELAGRLASLVDNVPGIVYRGHRDWSVSFMGAQVERVTGYTAGEFLSGAVKWKDLVHPEDLDAIKRTFREAVRGKKKVLRARYRARHRDGTYRTLADRRQIVYDGQGEFLHVDGLLLDITELDVAEKQARTAQRMEAVGTLAGGVAHDFNNALTGIFGFAEMLRMRLSADARAQADLNEILHCAERASTLTRQLLTYARRQAIEPVNLSLNSVATELMKLIGNVAGERIETRTLLEQGLPAVRADRGQIEQVLMNLCLNARDAMPSGGNLLVETATVHVDEEHLRQYPYMKIGRYVALSVTDTGIGMDKKIREKIFEPFFTTKGPEKGTGLGLAMVYGIVKRHDGYIHVFSEPGKGTTFRIHLPAVDAPPEERSTRGDETVRGGNETILLADDDEAVRKLAELALREYGYPVLTSRNGEDAVEIFRKEKEIGLVLLDVVMPKMGGREALAVMRGTAPGLKAILMSGYSFDESQGQGAMFPDVPLLQKPFGPILLAKKVREMLDGAGSSPMARAEATGILSP